MVRHRKPRHRLHSRTGCRCLGSNVGHARDPLLRHTSFTDAGHAKLGEDGMDVHPLFPLSTDRLHDRHRLFWLGGLTIASGWLVVAFTISLITTSAMQALPLWKHLPKETWLGRASQAERLQWSQVANSLGISTSAALILRETDVILVGIFADDQSAGIYMAATRIARLCSFALNATGSLVGPWISVRNRQGKLRELEHIVQISTLLSTLASLAIGLALIFLSGTLLRMFGPGFEAGQSIVTILLVGHIVNAATGPCGQILGLTGNQKIASRIYLVAAGIHLLGNWIASATTEPSVAPWQLPACSRFATWRWPWWSSCGCGSASFQSSSEASPPTRSRTPPTARPTSNRFQPSDRSSIACVPRGNCRFCWTSSFCRIK